MPICMPICMPIAFFWEIWQEKNRRQGPLFFLSFKSHFARVLAVFDALAGHLLTCRPCSLRNAAKSPDFSTSYTLPTSRRPPPKFAAFRPVPADFSPLPPNFYGQIRKIRFANFENPELFGKNPDKFAFSFFWMFCNLLILYTVNE